MSKSTPDRGRKPSAQRSRWRRVIPLLIASVTAILTAITVPGAPARADTLADPVGIHASTTVLTLEPLDFGTDTITGLMNSTLSGYAHSHSTAGAPVRVPSNSDLTMAGLLRARDQLDQTITSTAAQRPGPIVVFGWSRGAQVASEWLRSYANTAGRPGPDRLSFLLIGNPQRRLGGTQGAKTLEGRTLSPTPDSTGYRVVDLSRRFDGWANTDNWPGSPNDWATRTYIATVGKWTLHSNYSGQAVDAPANRLRARVGATDYLVGS